MAVIPVHVESRIRVKSLPYGCVLMLLAAASGSAADSSYGAELAPATAPATELETVYVYARRLTPVSRVAAAVSVLPADEIEARLATDIKQLVRYEPGLSVRSDPLRFGVDTVSVRGVGGNRVAIEIDGIPAAGGFAIGSFADSGRGYADLGFVRRVEVLRGPASALYGSDAIGGVLAMTTIAPRDLLEAGRTFAARTAAGYATADSSLNAQLIGAVSTSRADVMLGYVRREGEALDNPVVEPNPRDYTSDAWLAKLAFGAAGGSPVTLTIEGTRLAQQTDVQALLGLPGRFVNTIALHGDDSATRDRVSVDGTISDAAWADSADWRAYVQRTRADQATAELRRAPESADPALAIDRDFELGDETWGLELTAVKALAGAGTRHDLVYGVELEHARIEERRDGLQTDLATGESTSTILGEDLPVRDFPVTDATSVGVFVQDEIRTADGAWSVIPAVRGDYYRLEPRVDSMYREDNPTTPAVGLEDWSLAPKLGVTWRVNPSASAWFQYSRGFRSPPPEDVNIGLELPQFNVRAIPNPDLKPETSDGYELGFRFRGRAVQVAASAFYNDYRDFIESKVNLGSDPATGVTLFQSQNVAEARIYGAELSATLRPVAGPDWLTWWSVDLAAAWTRGEDRVRDVPLNSIDPPSAVVALRFDAPGGRWGAQMIATAVAAQHQVDHTNVNLYETDGYVTLDLLAGVELAPGLRIQAGIFNVADVHYIEWADVRGRAVGDPLIPYYTRPGRNAAVTLHWDF